MDAISVSALAVSIITALGALFSHLHLKRVRLFGCMESDCITSPPTTPALDFESRI
jgi:hypothetical protein